MLRGVNRNDIFLDSEDHERFLAVLRKCKSICGFELFAWCLMGNHPHLLIRPGQEPLSLIMKRIGCRYVYWFNKKYDRIGPLFQDRFRSEAVETEPYFLTCLRYILQNPHQAGLEKRLGSYPYSSFNAYLGHPDGLTDTDFAQGFFEDRARLVAFLKAPNREKALDIEPLKTRTTDADVLTEVEKRVKDAGKASFAELERDMQRACVAQLTQEGATVRQIAAATGLSKSTVSRMVRQ